jgi:crotonobetainyl-CoA:carnitine CoA-transferase CaiB-like acyl-CoA transferase
MGLLTGFRVVQLGRRMAARSAAGLFADVGAEIACIDPDRSTPLTQYLNHGKGVAASEAVGRAL